MTAREMFESLGYEEQFKGSDIYINRKYGARIAFDNYDGGTIDVVELCYIPRELLKAINMRCQELGWFEEEKHEIKQETNYEHYKDEILEYYGQNLAVVKGRPTLCCETNCNDCDFKINQEGCRKKVKEWLKQPYEKPTYKLTQFEYDLLNAYKNSGMRQCISNYGTLLELYKKGYFKDIGTSTPIHEILGNCEVTK